MIIAHRGASHDAPENTLAAFRLAWEKNADGIEGDSFFQKHTPDHVADWVPTCLVPSARRSEKATRFVMCNDRATLVYLANLACIELHPWSSRAGSLDSPDWAIFRTGVEPV